MGYSNRDKGADSLVIIRILMSHSESISLIMCDGRIGVTAILGMGAVLGWPILEFEQ